MMMSDVCSKHDHSEFVRRAGRFATSPSSTLAWALCGMSEREKVNNQQLATGTAGSYLISAGSYTVKKADIGT
jgi:hypothetical protein